MIRATFFGLEIGKSGLVLSQHGLDVTGHNIANVDTVGYTRQRLVHTAYDPFGKIGRTAPVSQANVGGGAYVKVHDQIRSAYLDRRFRTENTLNAYWQKRTEGLRYLESYFDNVVEETSINFSIARFFEAMKVLAEDTVEGAPRTLLQTAGKDLVQQLNTIYTGIVDLQESQNLMVRTTVDSINKIAKDIVELNKAIYGFEMTGHSANDLRDKRNLLIDELSNYIDVEYIEYPDGKGNEKHRVMIGGEILTDHDMYNQLDVRVGANVIAGEADVLVPVWIQNQALIGDPPMAVKYFGGVGNIIGSNAQAMVDEINRLADLIARLNGEITGVAGKVDAAIDLSGFADLAAALTAVENALNTPGTGAQAVYDAAQSALDTANKNFADTTAALKSAVRALANAEDKLVSATDKYNTIVPNYTNASTALTLANTALTTANSDLAAADAALAAAQAALAGDPGNAALQAAVTAALADRRIALAAQKDAEAAQKKAQSDFNKAEKGILAVTAAQAARDAAQIALVDAQTNYDAASPPAVDFDLLKTQRDNALAALKTAKTNLDDMNALMSLVRRRDAAADRLSGFVDGVVVTDGPTEYDPLTVTLATVDLVDATGVSNYVTTGASDTVFHDLLVTGGELKAYLDMRDGDGIDENARGIPYYVEMLNNLARALVQEINAVHRQGWTDPPVGASVNGVNFFSEDAAWCLEDNVTGEILRPDGSGGWLDENGDPIVPNPAPGSYTWQLDMSLITAKNLQLSKEVTESAFNIACSSVQIVKLGDPQDLQRGNNENMRAMYEIFLKKDIALGDLTTGTSIGSFDGFATSIRFDLGNTLSFSKKIADNSNTLTIAAENQRISISGVSLDEEMTHMIRYNHAYNGAARVITAMDDLLDKLINGTGRVGL